MALTINPGSSFNPGVRLRGFTPPTGLSSSDPSTSAWQIKQDYPSSPNGLYWIQNSNINGGVPVQIYADMITYGGGWTLIMLNNANAGNYWTKENAILRNPTTPPVTHNKPKYDDSQADLYSIIGWADYIKRSPSGFDYMIDAYDRGRNGGIWTANQPYSFIEQYNGQYMGDGQYQTAGWRKDITEITRFYAGAISETVVWNYSSDGIEARMPWYGLNMAGDGIDENAVNGFITTNGAGGYWYGTLITDAQLGNWYPAPWLSGGLTDSVSADVTNPGIIWYWVR